MQHEQHANIHGSVATLSLLLAFMKQMTVRKVEQCCDFEKEEEEEEEVEGKKKKKKRRRRREKKKKRRGEREEGEEVQSTDLLRS